MQLQEQYFPLISWDVSYVSLCRFSFLTLHWMFCRSDYYLGRFNYMFNLCHDSICLFSASFPVDDHGGCTGNYEWKFWQRFACKFRKLISAQLPQLQSNQAYLQCSRPIINWYNSSMSRMFYLQDSYFTAVVHGLWCENIREIKSLHPGISSVIKSKRTTEETQSVCASLFPSSHTDSF